MGTWPVNAVRPEYFVVHPGAAPAGVSGDDHGAGQGVGIQTGRAIPDEPATSRTVARGTGDSPTD